ncbi:SPFH domain-containing protein [Novosphingobium sp. G106]|uniref:SPFH domain-containing protein n=1 Tax=Novosphingobium sp. G106 TaxID=2849500 RepID=UPI001C2D9FF3|nr:SPFH domain-containing protein [Novosphingobium sp. G106]MBV1689473.1 SPFH domain-containing protein [Novosphingobium sp. G106]
MLEFLKKQFVDVIEWLEQPGQLAWRVPFADHEIQTGAQLTVRETQMAAFLNEGKLADYFGPGLHRLTTANLPILTDLKNWDKAFNSPFKSDVVFFSMKEHLGLKWGTAQPITVRDAEFGAMRLRAFGTYSFRIAELEPFASRLLGTLGEVSVASLEPQLRAAIQTAIATALGGSGIPFLDLASNQQKLSDQIKIEVDKTFAQWGLGCLSFYVENVSLPEEVQAHLDKGSSMRVIGDLDRYTKFQTAEAIEKAAGQEGGLAGLGAGIGAAAALGGAMSQSLAGVVSAPAAAPAPATPAAAAADEDPFALIEKLHKLVTIGALSQEEFDAKKAELLARIK